MDWGVSVSILSALCGTLITSGGQCWAPLSKCLVVFTLVSVMPESSTDMFLSLKETTLHKQILKLLYAYNAQSYLI